MFYEPCYHHGIDTLMDSYSNVDLHPTDIFDAIVTETTYMLTTANRDPVAGYPPGEDTHFVLPYTTFPGYWYRPGMTMAGIVDLVVASGQGTSQLTDGAIEVQRSYEDVPIGTELNFMDHNITITDITEMQGVRVNLEYVGNMMEEHSADQTHYGLDVGDKKYVNRANKVQDTSDPAYRWYMQIDWRTIDPDDPNLNTIDITLGRHLAAGETFYVNGVRYDMPAIYVTDDGAFKYITLQTPLPKCEGVESPIWDTPVTDNYEDWSHVTSQWLANVPQEHYLWFLPPFIDETFAGVPWSAWRMVDDIGLWKNNTLWDQEDIDIEIPEMGILINQSMESLEGLVTWQWQTDYCAFNTTLAQRLYVDGDEEWDWWSVYTKPIHYTLINFPDLEVEGMTYDVEDLINHNLGWYMDFLNWTQMASGLYEVDGAEYLLTTSWLAPNCEHEERHAQSKSAWCVHDIIGGATVPEPGPGDWNPWDDDGVITLQELQDAIDHWVNDIPKNDHMITLSELQDLITMWLTT
jgi:hypothetical protein